MSERLLRVLAQHDNNAITLETPCFIRGAAEVAAFSGHSFGLMQKSASPAVRLRQCLNRSMYQIELMLTRKSRDKSTYLSSVKKRNGKSKAEYLTRGARVADYNIQHIPMFHPCRDLREKLFHTVFPLLQHAHRQRPKSAMTS